MRRKKAELLSRLFIALYFGPAALYFIEREATSDLFKQGQMDMEQSKNSRVIKRGPPINIKGLGRTASIYY